MFTWKLFLNRLQTRDKLGNRRVILDVYSLVCPLCLYPEESHSHMFIDCIVVVEVWSCILDLIGLSRFSPFISMTNQLLKFDTALRGRTKRKLGNLTYLVRSCDVCLVYKK